MPVKFLILRFSSIGDIVLTTPVVRCLKKQYPHAEIHYFTKPAFESILSSNPYIDKVHILDNKLLNKSLQLKQLGFDYIIDLHHNLRTAIIAGILQCPVFSFNKLNLEKSALVLSGIHTLPDVHIVDRYLDTLNTFGIVNDQEGLDFFIPEETRQQFSFEKYGVNHPFIAMAIGAQHSTKRMPVAQLIAVIKQLQLPVVLLGGGSDEEVGKTIVSQLPDKVINLCGQLTLNESALMIERSNYLITHDTGLMHIGAALKKPIVSIWGNTIPSFGMYPYYGKYNIPQRMHEVADLTCRPCSKIGYNECPKKHFNCMNKQDVQAIAQIL